MMAAGFAQIWQSTGLAAGLARLCLAPLSWVFGLAVRIRGFCYDRGLLRVERVGATVVSVGNLSVGGSGKTPLVLWLVQRMRAEVATVVVSRGYGVALERPLVLLPRSNFDETRLAAVAAAASGADVVAVGASRRGDAAALPAVDEPLLIALRSGCAVVVWPDRVEAATIAERALGARLIVLDDGFQHRRLHRDVDIVVLGEGDLGSRLLPVGPLREGRGALARADIVVAAEHGVADMHLLRAAGSLVRWPHDPQPQSASLLGGREILAFAGVARPRAFAELLQGLGASIREFIVFADHHVYTDADWQTILAASSGASQIVTTEKDLVKLGELGAGEPRLLALCLDIEVEGGQRLIDRVRAQLVRAKT